MRKGRLFLSLFVLVGIVVIWTVVKQMFFPEEKLAKSTVVDEMLALIEQHSVYKPQKEVLVERALKGMAQAINDPYSTYYTESEAKLHEAALSEQKAGIGIELTENAGKFVIVAPMKESPAEKAGVQPLDELVQIDNEKLHGLSMQQVQKDEQNDLQLQMAIGFLMHKLVND